MKHIFLCSSFSQVVPLFTDFVTAEELKGKTVTFIPTASLTEKVTFYVKAGKKALEEMECIVEELDISSAHIEEIESKLRTNDIIYITGGNTFFLLQELRKSGADRVITSEVLNGKTYIGESAGAMILSPDIEYVRLMDDIEYAPDLSNLEGLGIVDFYTVPHHTNFPFVKAVRKIIQKYDSSLPLRPISNLQAIAIRDKKVSTLTLED